METAITSAAPKIFHKVHSFDNIALFRISFCSVRGERVSLAEIPSLFESLSGAFSISIFEAQQCLDDACNSRDFWELLSGFFDFNMLFTLFCMRFFSN